MKIEIPAVTARVNLGSLALKKSIGIMEKSVPSMVPERYETKQEF